MTFSVALIASLALVSPASADAAWCTVSCPTATAGGYVYAYDAQTDSFVPVPPTATGSLSAGATYTYALSPACPQNGPFSDSGCAGAGQFCTSTGSSGLHDNVWRKQLEPTATDWVIVGNVCIGQLPDAIDARQVLADVSEYERLNVPTPQPQLQPAGGALVNLPVIVSVPDIGQQAMAVRQPVPGRLVATPSYSWTFDDGTVLAGAGRPYDGTDPRQATTHYLSYTYREPTASASVTLTVTWHAAFTAGGRTFTITPLTMPLAASRFPVYAAHAVLVDGGSP